MSVLILGLIIQSKGLNEDAFSNATSRITTINILTWLRENVSLQLFALSSRPIHVFNCHNYVMSLAYSFDDYSQVLLALS